MVVAGLLLTILFGWVIVWLLRINFSRLGKLSLSYLLGIGFQTLLMFYLGVLGIKINLLNVTLVTVLVSVVLLFTGRYILKVKDEINPFGGKITFNFRDIRGIEKILLTIISILFLYVLVAGLYWPVVGWDSIALYDFRAKVFAITGYMDDAIRRGYFFGYPLMTSMAHTWVYLLGGAYPKFLYSLMYMSLGVLFFELMLKWTSRITAMIYTLLVLIAPPIFSHAAFDYTNLPYTIYFFLGSVFLCVWAKERKMSWLILSSMTMGISSWIRSTDPFWVINLLVLVAILLIERRKIVNFIVYLVFFFAVQQSWSIFLSYHAPHVTTGDLALKSSQILLEGLDIGRALQVGVFVVEKTWLVLLLYLLLLLLTIAINRPAFKKHLYLFLVVFGNFALLFVGSYIFSFIYPGWDLIGESLGRMSFVFIPLFLFLSGVNLDIKEYFKIKE